MAERIALRLGLDPSAKSEFLSLILRNRIERPKKNQPTRKIDEADPEYRQLTIDAFYVISDWYHFAILNLRDCDDFQNDDAWIARRLNLSVGEVRLALTRLDRLGLIERRKDGWVRTHAHLTTSHDVRSAGLRKGHRGILQRAIDALEAVDVEERDITNMTMAINTAHLPEAKAMLARFRKKFAKSMERGKDRTEVYTLALQFFPLTQTRKKGKSL
jgi:uncharacterized protein (TIGR02147 family)